MEFIQGVKKKKTAGIGKILAEKREAAKDYRYVPESDLLPVFISRQWIEAVQLRQPELREEKQNRYQKEFGLSWYDADIMTGNKHMAELFEKVASL